MLVNPLNIKLLLLKKGQKMYVQGLYSSLYLILSFNSFIFCSAVYAVITQSKSCVHTLESYCTECARLFDPPALVHDTVGISHIVFGARGSWLLHIERNVHEHLWFLLDRITWQLCYW